MMKVLILSTLLFLFAFSIVNAAGNPGRFIKTADGVIIYPDPLFESHTGIVVAYDGSRRVVQLK